MKNSSDDLKYILTTHKQRVTEPRLAVLRVLSNNKKPLTIAGIHSKLNDRTIDLATVYRIIKLFLKLKILSEVDFREEFKRYELTFDRKHHHHIVCTTCGEVKDIEVCGIEITEEKIGKAGYKDISHSLEFFGICPLCNKKKRND